MRCSNCGKDVPFTGKVCNWCNADKSRDQLSQTLGMIFGLAGGGLGWLIHGIGAAFIGLIVGVIVGLFAASRLRS